MRKKIILAVLLATVSAFGSELELNTDSAEQFKKQAIELRNMGTWQSDKLEEAKIFFLDAAGFWKRYFQEVKDQASLDDYRQAINTQEYLWSCLPENARSVRSIEAKEISREIAELWSQFLKKARKDSSEVTTKDYSEAGSIYETVSCFYDEKSQNFVSYSKNALWCYEKKLELKGENVRVKDLQEYISFCEKLADALDRKEERNIYIQKSVKYREKLINKDNTDVQNYRMLARNFTKLLSSENLPNDKKREYLLKITQYWELFFQNIGQKAISGDYFDSGFSYYLLGFELNSLEDRIQNNQKALRLFEEYVTRAGANISLKEYDIIGKSYHLLGIILDSEEGNVDYFIKASEYFQKVLDLQKSSASFDEKMQAIMAYDGAGWWSNNAQEKKNFFTRAAHLANQNPFSNNDDLNKYAAVLINVYQNVASVTTGTQKHNYLSKKFKLLKEIGALCVRRLGNQIFLLDNDEFVAWNRQYLLPSSNANSEKKEQGSKEDHLMQELPAVNQQISEKKEENNDVDVSNEDVKQENAMSPEKDLEEKTASSMSNAMGFSVKKEKIAKPTKEEKKLKKILKQTAERNAMTTGQKISDEEDEALMLNIPLEFDVYMAYKNPEEQKKVFGVLEDIIEIKKLNTIKENKIETYLKRLSFFLGGTEGKTHEGPFFVILGKRFGYAPAHGSWGGDWDKGRMGDFVSFAEEVKARFLQIIEMGQNLRR